MPERLVAVGGMREEEERLVPHIEQSGHEGRPPTQPNRIGDAEHEQRDRTWITKGSTQASVSRPRPVVS